MFIQSIGPGDIFESMFFSINIYINIATMCKITDNKTHETDVQSNKLFGTLHEPKIFIKQKL